MKKSVLLACTILAVANGSAAFAQDAGAPATGNPQASVSSEASNDGSEIGEIIVTAQFRETNLQQTPISITAVNSAMLEARGIAKVSDVAQSAPNVTLAPSNASSGKSMAAFIRGIGQSDYNPALEPGVGVYIDDVYYATVYGSAFDLVDPDRIEVLRGPQGTLTGKNSIGGAIKLFTKKPDGNGGGYVQASYGSHEKIDVRAGANFTLVPDKLFARVSVLGRHGGGYVTRYDYGCLFPASGVPSSGSVTGSGCKLGKLGDDNLVAGRLAIRALPTDNLEINLVADVTKDHSGGTPQTLISAAGASGFFSFIDISQFVPSSPFVSYGSFARSLPNGGVLAFEPKSRASNWGLSGTVDYDLGGGFSLKSITAYRETQGEFVVASDNTPLIAGPDIPGFGIPSALILFNLNLNSNQFTQELRLNGQLGDGFHFTVGGFYLKSNVDAPGRSFAYGTFDLIQGDGAESTSKAVFAQAELAVTDQFKLIGGVRYTKDAKDYTFRRADAATPPYGLFGLFGLTAATNNVTGSFRGDRLDYRLAANYQVTPDVMVYGQVASGYKGGGINPRPFYSTQIVPFDPETVVSYEGGVKSQFFDRRMRLNLSAFYSDYKDIQLTLGSCPDLIPPGAAPLCNLVANAGDAHIKGIEAETTIQPIDGVLIDGSVGYLDFNYTRKNSALAPGSVGNISPFTPNWKAAVGMQYQAQLGSTGSLTPRLDWIYQSGVYSDVANTAPALQSGYSVFNGRLTWRSESENWEVAAAVTNLFDKRYYLNRDVSFVSAYNFVSGIPGRPREWSVTLKRTF